MPLSLNGPAHLATAPKLRDAGDTLVCELYVFAKDTKRVQGGYADHPISVEVWGNSARAAAKHLTKGSLINIVGSLRYREYDKDGQTIGKYYIDQARVDFLHIKKTDDGTGVERHQPADQDIPS